MDSDARLYIAAGGQSALTRGIRESPSGTLIPTFKPSADDPHTGFDERGAET